jgi:hypothetical protein
MILEHRHEPGGVLPSLGPELLMRALRSNPVLVEHKARIVSLLERMVDEAKGRGEIVNSIPTSVIVRSMFCLQSALTDQEPDLDCSLKGIIHLFMYGIVPRASASSEDFKENSNL